MSNVYDAQTRQEALWHRHFTDAKSANIISEFVRLLDDKSDLRRAWEAGRDAAATLCEQAIRPELETISTDIEKGWNEALRGAAGAIRKQTYEG